MTEAEWLACTDPGPMLEFLRGKASDRKLRLFAVASFRRALAHFRSEGWDQAIEVGERYADGLANLSELPDTDAEGFLWDAPMAVRMRSILTGADPNSAAAVAAAWATGQKRKFIGGEIHAFPRELPIQAGLLRDVFRSPFHPVPVDPEWLTFAVVALAAGIYADRAFDRLPILADALLDAGCDDEDVLSHCRSAGPHVRGCWVVDLLLGKS